MLIAVGSDERTSLTEGIVAYLRSKGLGVELFGPMSGEASQWAQVELEVGRAVASGRCHQGLLLCWTGTGVSIAANKVPGVRAALCADAETARGARLWNHANVLALSLHRTSLPVATKILEAWLATGEDPEEARNVALVAQAEGPRQAAPACVAGSLSC